MARTGRPKAVLVLDDLPGAKLVSGYAFLRADAVRPDDRLRQNLKVDICTGWAEDATMIASIREMGQTPTPFGPRRHRLRTE